MSWSIPQPWGEAAQLFRSGECFDRDCHPARELRSEFLTQWLRGFKSDPLRMSALRQMLARESTSANAHRASDDAVIDEAVRLLSAGIWHVHAANFTQSTGASKGKWKQAPGIAHPRPPARKSCRLKTSYGNCLVIRASDLGPGEEFLEHTPSSPLEFKELTPSLEAAEFLEAFPSVRGGIPNTRGLSVAQLLENALRSGALVLVRDQTSAGAGGGGGGAGAQSLAPRSSTASSTSTAKVTEKTWFRMQLLDEDGEPMAGEDYKVIDSAGASHQGKLDDSGEFYIPPTLPPGDCTISFPNIHLNPRKKKS